jgi:hypothetical protein
MELISTNNIASWLGFIPWRTQLAHSDRGMDDRLRDTVKELLQQS